MACIKPGSQLDRDRQKWEAHLVAQGVPATEAAARAESMAVNSRVAALKKKRQQLWLDTKARVDIEDAMKASPGDMADAMLDMIERASLRPGDAFQTAHSRTQSLKSIMGAIIAPAREVLERAHMTLDDAARAALNIDIKRELLGLGSNSPDARKAAWAFTRLADFQKTTANAAGMDIKSRSDWGYRASYDPELVAPDGKADQFVDDLVNAYSTPGTLAPLLDENGAPLAGAELREVVEGMADNIRSGNVTGTIGRLPGAIKSRHKQPRIINWIDQEARLAFDNKYSQADILADIDRGIDTFSREIGTMQVLGANPDGNYAWWRQKAERAGVSDIKLLTVDTVYLSLTGGLDRPASPMLARRFGTLRTFFSLTMLPRAVLSQFSDFVPRSMVLAGNNVPVIRAVADYFASLPKKLSPEDIEAVTRLGVDAELGIRALIDEGVTDSARSIQWMNEQMFRMTGFRKVNQVGSMLTQQKILSALADARSLAFDKADEALGGRLSRYGYTPAEWDALRSLPVERYNGIDYMSVDAVISSSLPESQKLDLAQRMMHHVGTDARIATTQPGPKAKAFTAIGGQRGTLLGEAGRNIMQFKGFGTQNILNMTAEFIRKGNAQDKAQFVAAILMGTTALGMVSLQSKRLVSGKGLAEMDPTTEEGRATWLAAMFQGGGFGIIGDFVSAGLGSENRFGHGFVTTLAGPTAGAIEDVTKLTLGNIGQAGRDERANFMSETLKLAPRYTPFVGMPFVKLAADRLLVDKLRLMADPSGTRRSFMATARRERENFGATDWWAQGETLPEFMQ